jgi:aerobic carbon-monoxide dehydrogenase small subunit
MPDSVREITLAVNGSECVVEVEARLLLADLLRDKLALTGTHIGCEQGVCGACTVLVDGVATRSCLMFAVQAAGARVTTVEALGAESDLGPLQRAFSRHDALQCGFCTAGMLIAAFALLEENPSPSEDDVRQASAGNLCRCTGYEPIVDALLAAAREQHR